MLSSVPDPGALYLALIYVHPGQRPALRRYEELALPLFRRHGGRFERILSPSAASDAPDVEAPDEVHLLRFDTADGIEALRRDPAMEALVPLRQAAVRKALLIRVEDVPLERYFSSGP
jgi:uncharacterized protein (DUF1330 family)